MEKLCIRNETENDFKIVEHITREAFYNLYIPGCDEHYLVNIMRSHEDFIPELAFVLELNGQVIGNIMYTKARLTDESGMTKHILTFGPVSILPEFQRRGYGRLLLEHSFSHASLLGFDTIVIMGNPDNYAVSGFKSCRKFNICLEDGSYPSAMLVKELKNGVLDGRKWFYYESEVYHVDQKNAQEFDVQLETKEKKYQPSQEVFYILSHSVIQ